MSQKYSTTTADYLVWSDAMNLIRKLVKDGNYKMSLLIAIGCFTGLRISDILSLRWKQILGVSEFTITEKKTGKRRVVKVNKGFQKHIKQCYDSLHITNEDEKCFLSRKKMVYSTQRINILFKEIKQKYNLKIEHFSTHTMRKTFGRKVFESAGTDAPLALMRLQTLFNHASPTITKKYLGITDSELESSYDLLDF
jgi:integrase